VKILLRLLPLCVFAVFLLVALYALSSGIIPGMPGVTQKNVTVYYPPKSESSGLSAFLQPPMATLQVQGGNQALSVQFTNHTKGSVLMGPLHVHPDDCFALASVENAPREIEAGGNLVVMYRLDFLKDGHGRDGARCDEPQPLTLHYEWTAVPAAARLQARRVRGRLRKPPVSVPATPQQVTISTSPITITTTTRNTWERFYHAGGAIAIPALLGILTLLFQQGQRRRDDEQKAQTFKLEVWKTVLDDIVGLIKTHYIPISRKMSAAREEISGGVNERILIALIVLRRFYFRSKTAESLCRALSNLFWKALYGFTDKDKFVAAVDQLQLGDSSFQGARTILKG